MNKREKFKIVDIAGRKWRIEKFDALTGSYIAYKVMGHILPMGLDSVIKGEAAQQNKQNEPVQLPAMSKKEFADLQLDCLHICYEMLPAGKAPVIGENNAWGVADIEDDAALVLALTVHALLFNIGSFFAEGGLQALTESFAGTSLFIAPTLTNGSMPQS